MLISLKSLLYFFLFLVCLSVSNGRNSHHFVLVHGSCHGAWSWYKVVALLRSHGHRVTAVDLAASGIDSRQARGLRSVAEYHQPLMEFMEELEAVALDQKVVLVGHSLGGMAVCQAMERFPEKISVAVFVTAVMPGPRLNISDLNKEAFSRTGSLMDSIYTYDDGPDEPPTTLTFGSWFLESKVYQFSPIEDLALATTLMRPVKLFADEDLSKLIVLTTERYGSVRRVFIVSEKDEVSKKEFQQWMIERNPPDDVVEVLGSDHMVMVSKPKQLLAHLLRIAESYYSLTSPLINLDRWV